MKKLLVVAMILVVMACAWMFGSAFTSYEAEALDEPVVTDEPALDEPVVTDEPALDEPVDEEVTVDDVIDAIQEQVNNEEVKGQLELLRDELKNEQVNYVNLLTIFGSILSAVALAVVGLVCKILRLKLAAIDREKIYADFEARAKAEYDARFNVYMSKLNSTLGDLDKKVSKRLDRSDAERKADVEANSTKLNEAVQEVLKKTDISKYLNLD